MKIISNIATLCMSFGLAILAGSFIFGAGSLTVIGWLVAVPLFLGSTGHVALSIYNMIPERKKDGVQTPADEKNNKKPGTQTANAQ